MTAVERVVGSGPGAEAFAGMTIIDADTHLTEPHDLWTSRAPKGWEERLPRVVDIDGEATWVFDGARLFRAGAMGVVSRDGRKVPGTEFFRWVLDDVHPGAYSIPERLEVMDSLGIWAQIVYPNAVGLGSQRFVRASDPDARLMAVKIYNDAMAEMQEASGGRLAPMGAIPWWDVAAAVGETERIDALGLHGINTTSAPQEHGFPDLGDRHWDPVWEAASGCSLPVNFHIGASDSAMDWFGSSPWESLGADQKLGVGSAMLYLNNAKVLANLLYSGVLERFPALNVVSVESGVGWIPFVLEALDYGVGEMAPGAMDYLSMAPSEYFRRQVYACFWFERAGLTGAIEALGAGHVLFETDFPHPTCTYPDGLQIAAEALAQVKDRETRVGVMGGNAARLYHLPLPG
jgi:uncharacterized protein